MTFVIVGASAGLGRALAEKFASEGHDLIIISSELKDLNAIKGDLQNRFNVKIFPIERKIIYEINLTFIYIKDICHCPFKKKSKALKLL